MVRNAAPQPGTRTALARRLLSRPGLTAAGLGALAVALLLVPVTLNLRDSRAATILEYREAGRAVTVRADDGCLVYRRDLGARRGFDEERGCGWQRPAGVPEWAPQTRELLVLDPARRHVVELVAFGMVPDETHAVRYTLPGGKLVEPAVHRRDDLDHPAFWIHLTGVAIPVDLRTVDGAAAFERFQILDAAGNDIATV